MRKPRILGTGCLLGIILLSFLLAGCAAGTAGGPTQAAAPSPMEDLLTQAGFKILPESSPKCQEVCRKLTPEQLTPHKKGDQMVYAYYAPATHRLYVGDETAYQTFINLAVTQNLAPRKRAVYETVPNDPEFWQMWQDYQGGG